MSGAIPPFPNIPSWRGAQSKKSTGTTLPLPFIRYRCKDGSTPNATIFMKLV
jgi:hypothetical protein